MFKGHLKFIPSLSQGSLDYIYTSRKSIIDTKNVTIRVVKNISQPSQTIVMTFEAVKKYSRL